MHTTTQSPARPTVVNLKRRAAPAPIAFPDTQLDDKVRERRALPSERQQVVIALQAMHDLRMAEAVKAAFENGKIAGQRAGWHGGTNWGIFCGAFGAVLLIACFCVVLALCIGGHGPRLF